MGRKESNQTNKTKQDIETRPTNWGYTITMGKNLMSICFHGMMYGPLVFYNDYISFIDGTVYKTLKQGQLTEDILSPWVRI